MSREAQLAENLEVVRSEIAPYAPTLVVVTKTYPVSDVEILHRLGCGDFGENRSAEGAEKSSVVDATWHFQGQIQSNKIREISQWADVVHSLDSLPHARKLSAARESNPIDIFLQLSLDGNPDRGGVVESELATVASEVSHLPGLRLRGLMSVPPVEMQPDPAFKKIADIHRRFTADFPDARALSMGMSGDYLVALEHGATHIRIGSKILGSRTYLK
jgi:pyridoxal phosphate enzyme (YggS family)